jgi:RNA 2',3'-cyclic 3'-phosphodiesterase
VVEDVLMRLYAAIVPPEAARAELVDLVQSVAPGTPELRPVAAADMRIPVTSFGNVTHSDSLLLLDALHKATAGWARPRLRFHGSAALEWEGDRSVWSKVDGDVDQLLTIGRGVPIAIQPLGFLVDRRKFRSWLEVGTITEVTSLPYLEKLAGALDAFQGSSWTLETLTVFKKVPVDEQGIDEVVLEEVPLREA